MSTQVPTCPFCTVKRVKQNMKMIADADSIIGETWKCENKH